jgi:hypothetical protein
MAAQGCKNRLIHGATAELTQMPMRGDSGGLEEARAVLKMPYGTVLGEDGKIFDSGWLVASSAVTFAVSWCERGVRVSWYQMVCFYAVPILEGLPA